MPCTFPFVYDGTEFDACTSHGDPDNALWCSTQTDESGQHIGGGQVTILSWDNKTFVICCDSYYRDFGAIAMQAAKSGP